MTTNMQAEKCAVDGTVLVSTGRGDHLQRWCPDCGRAYPTGTFGDDPDDHYWEPTVQVGSTNSLAGFDPWGSALAALSTGD